MSLMPSDPEELTAKLMLESIGISSRKSAPTMSRSWSLNHSTLRCINLSLGSLEARQISIWKLLRQSTKLTFSSKSMSILKHTTLEWVTSLKLWESSQKCHEWTCASRTPRHLSTRNLQYLLIGTNNLRNGSTPGWPTRTGNQPNT